MCITDRSESLCYDEAMCEWRSELRPDYRCKVPREPGSEFCILHKSGEKDVSKFKEVLYRQIDREGSKDERNDPLNFRGYVFPVGIGAVEEHREEESDVIVPDRLEDDLTLAEAEINGAAYFFAANFTKDADFTLTRFNGFACFTGARFEEGADFSRATFRRKADFWGVRVDLGSLFNGATFEMEAVFRDTKFNLFASFAGVTFKGDVDFTRAQASDIYFGDERPTILRLAGNREGVSLQKWSSGYTLWAFARKTFHSIDERERADAAYYFEKIWQRRSRLSRTSSTRTRILAGLGYPFDLLLLRLPIAYGTSLVRTLMSWLVVLLLFGGLYAGFPSLIGRTSPSIWTLRNWVISMHFSVTTFTTLGLGDIHPERLSGKALTSIEAVVGGVLMALTVVVISRKLMR